MGKLLLSSILVIVCRVGHQVSGGPSGVLAQSNERMSSPISPPPAKTSSSCWILSGVKFIGDFPRLHNRSRLEAQADLASRRPLDFCTSHGTLSRPSGSNLSGTHPAGETGDSSKDPVWIGNSKKDLLPIGRPGHVSFIALVWERCSRPATR